MKKLLVYTIVLMFVLPVGSSESKPVPPAANNTKTELSEASFFGKKKNKKGKKKRKDIYRPGARQN